MKNKILIAIIIGIFSLGAFVFANYPSDISELNHKPEDKINNDITYKVDFTKQSEVTINIKDFSYNPSNIKIKKGTKVTWINQDVMEHNVMREHEHRGVAHPAPTLGEIRPNIFAGPLLAQGETYSFVFNNIGINPYHCAPHPYMKGMVNVVE